MFYGNAMYNPSIDNVDELYNTLVIEQENFDKIITSMNILQENGILFEANNKSLWQRIKDLWNSFIKWLKGIVGKIIRKKKKNDRDVAKKKADQALKKAKSVKTDKSEPVVVKVYKIKEEFAKVIEDEYVPAMNKYGQYINNFKDTLGKVNRGTYDGDPGELSFDDNYFKKNIESIFDKFGGIKSIDEGNEKVFEIVECSDKNEIDKILDEDFDTIGKIMNIAYDLNETVGRLRYMTSQELRDDLDYEEWNDTGKYPNTEKVSEVSKKFKYLTQSIHDSLDSLIHVGGRLRLTALDVK